MDKLIASWAEAFDADVFYNYIRRDGNVECLLVISFDGDITVYKGMSKTLKLLTDGLKAEKVAKLIAQSEALQECILPSIKGKDTSDDDALEAVSKEAMEFLAMANDIEDNDDDRHVDDEDRN